MTDLSPSSRLRAVGLRVTKPRIAVIEVLDDARAGREHLTVAEVAGRVRGRIGTMSTQAAYDCLDVLTDNGVVRRIEPAGHPTRYETRVGDNHHHVVCRHCGLTTDVDGIVGAATCLTLPEAGGFAVEEVEITFWGRCAACAAAPAASRD
jgi:Fur family transcriptional regulator, stress-responsive regulator